MKIQEMTLKLAEELMTWWIDSADSRVDGLKDPDLLYNLLFNDEGRSKFYGISGLVFVVNTIIPGSSALVYELGVLDGKYEPKEGKRMLIDIVREFDLKRLMFSYPSPVTDFSPKLKDLGFKYEGRLRYASTYQGRLSDIDIFGFYSVKPSNRRRRGRRDGRKESSFENGNGASNPTVESNGEDGEAPRSRSLEGEVIQG